MERQSGQWVASVTLARADTIGGSLIDLERELACSCMRIDESNKTWVSPRDVDGPSTTELCFGGAGWESFCNKNWALGVVALIVSKVLAALHVPHLELCIK